MCRSCGSPCTRRPSRRRWQPGMSRPRADAVDLPTLLVAVEATSSPSSSMGIGLRRVRSSVFMAQHSSCIWTATCALSWYRYGPNPNKDGDLIHCLRFQRHSIPLTFTFTLANQTTPNLCPNPPQHIWIELDTSASKQALSVFMLWSFDLNISSFKNTLCTYM